MTCVLRRVWRALTCSPEPGADNNNNNCSLLLRLCAAPRLACAHLLAA
jgi:hypothetical protein